MVEVKSEDPQRKYHRTIKIPAETDILTANKLASKKQGGKDNISNL